MATSSLAKQTSAAATMSSGATLSQKMAGYIHGERFENLDTKTVAQAKHLIAYHVGLAFLGLRRGDAHAKQALAVARDLSEGGGSSRIIGVPYKATAVDAAMVNCTMMRANGLDDVIFPSGLHPGLVTLPVAMTLAERHHKSGKDLITAIVVAYEILGKFGRWTWSGNVPRRSIMPFGPFGSIAVAARLLDLSLEQTAHSIGYAAHTAMGVAEGDAGPITHYYSMVCRNGLTGAYLTRAGGTSSPYVLEGKFGFLETFFGSADFDDDAFMNSLGHDFMVMKSCEKRYPGTALNQVPIELMRSLIEDTGLKADDIESMHLKFPVERQNFHAGHLTKMLNRTNAASSAAFQIAILLLDGKINEARYDDYTNADIANILGRTTFEFVKGKPVRYAKINVRTRNGQSHIREGEDFIFPAEPNRAIMEREATGILPKAKIDQFIDVLDHLDQIDDAAKLMEALVP